MTDSVCGRLGENVVGHCMSQETPHHRLRYTANRCDLPVSSGAIDGHSLRQFVSIDSAERDQISPLKDLSKQSCEIMVRGPTQYRMPIVALTGPWANLFNV